MLCQRILQVFTGVGGLNLSDLFRRTRSYYIPAAVAGAGAKVDYIISVLDHIQVVLDEDNGIATVDQAVQHPEQSGGIFEGEPCSRLIEDI